MCKFVHSAFCFDRSTAEMAHRLMGPVTRTEASDRTTKACVYEAE